MTRWGHRFWRGCSQMICVSFIPSWSLSAWFVTINDEPVHLAAVVQFRGCFCRIISPSRPSALFRNKSLCKATYKEYKGWGVTLPLGVNIFREIAVACDLNFQEEDTSFDFLHQCENIRIIASLLALAVSLHSLCGFKRGITSHSSLYLKMCFLHLLIFFQESLVHFLYSLKEWYVHFC